MTIPRDAGGCVAYGASLSYGGQGDRRRAVVGEVFPSGPISDHRLDTPFKQFVRSNARSEWIFEENLGLYVRKVRLPNRLALGVDFEIANMYSNNPGNGGLTRFLDKYDHVHGFFIENIVNDRLIPFFEKRGYDEQVSNFYIHMFKARA